MAVRKGFGLPVFRLVSVWRKIATHSLTKVARLRATSSGSTLTPHLSTKVAARQCADGVRRMMGDHSVSRVPRRKKTSHAGSQSPVEPSECVGKHERLKQDARPEHQHMPGLAQIEAADTTDEHVAHSKIEEAPQNIDHRGGQAFPGW